MTKISFKELKQIVLQDQIDYAARFGEVIHIANVKREFKSISNIEDLANYLCGWGYDYKNVYHYLLSRVVKEPRKTIKHKSRSKNTKQRSKK